MKSVAGRLLKILSSSKRSRQPGLLIAHDSMGKLISVDDAERGFACGLVCPVCGKPMSAKQGDVMEWHFAHQPGEHCNRSSWVAVQGRALLASWLQPGCDLRLPHKKRYGELSRPYTVTSVEEDSLFRDKIAVKVTMSGKDREADLTVLLEPAFERSMGIRPSSMAIRVQVPLITNLDSDEARQAFLSSWRREWLYISEDHLPPSRDPQRDRWRQEVMESRGMRGGADAAQDRRWENFWRREPRRNR